MLTAVVALIMVQQQSVCDVRRFHFLVAWVVSMVWLVVTLLVHHPCYVLVRLLLPPRSRPQVIREPVLLCATGQVYDYYTLKDWFCTGGGGCTEALITRPTGADQARMPRCMHVTCMHGSLTMLLTCLLLSTLGSMGCLYSCLGQGLLVAHHINPSIHACKTPCTSHHMLRPLHGEVRSRRILTMHVTINHSLCCTLKQHLRNMHAWCMPETHVHPTDPCMDMHTCIFTSSFIPYVNTPSLPTLLSSAIVKVYVL